MATTWLVALTVLPRSHGTWTVPNGVILVAASRVYFGLHHPLDATNAAI